MFFLACTAEAAAFLAHSYSQSQNLCQWVWNLSICSLTCQPHEPQASCCHLRWGSEHDENSKEVSPQLPFHTWSPMSFCQNPTIWPQMPSWISAHCLTDSPPSVLTRTNLEIPVPSRRSNEHRERASFWGATKGDSYALSMQWSPEQWVTQVSLLVQWTLRGSLLPQSGHLVSCRFLNLQSLLMPAASSLCLYIWPPPRFSVSLILSPSRLPSPTNNFCYNPGEQFSAVRGGVLVNTALCQYQAHPEIYKENQRNSSYIFQML